jgi:hypothetical protein
VDLVSLILGSPTNRGQGGQLRCPDGSTRFLEVMPVDAAQAVVEDPSTQMFF